MGEIVAVLGPMFANFGRVTITDIIDIAIMAFLIYKLLGIVRASSSGKVVLGIGLVLAALWLSDICHLYTVNYLLRRLYRTAGPGCQSDLPQAGRYQRHGGGEAVSGRAGVRRRRHGGYRGAGRTVLAGQQPGRNAGRNGRLRIGAAGRVRGTAGVVPLPGDRKSVV